MVNFLQLKNTDAVPGVTSPVDEILDVFARNGGNTRWESRTAFILEAARVFDKSEIARKSAPAAKEIDPLSAQAAFLEAEAASKKTVLQRVEDFMIAVTKLEKALERAKNDRDSFVSSHLKELMPISAILKEVESRMETKKETDLKNEEADKRAEKFRVAALESSREP